MVRAFPVVWSNQAKGELKKIYRYIKNRESAERAQKVRNQIISEAGKLGFMPDKFAEEPELKDKPGIERFRTIHNFKLIYEIETSRVVILDLFYTSRNPNKLRSLK